MHDLLKSFIQLFHTNQFLSGGALLGLGGLAVKSTQQIPQRVLERLLKLFYVEIEIRNNDPAYDFAFRWVDQLPSCHKWRSIAVNTMDLCWFGGHNNRYTPENKKKLPILFSPAPGTYWTRFQDVTICIQRIRQETNNANANLCVEILKFKIFQRNARSARLLMEQILSQGRNQLNGETILYNYDVRYETWRALRTASKRPLDTVILPDGQMEMLVNDCEAFLQSQEWYRQSGIPYHRGYLLYGEPGTGKSSTILALANRFGLDIYLFPSHLGREADINLETMVSKVTAPAILLIEDVDSLYMNREQADTNEFSFRSMLNTIDGVGSTEGMILFLTTNHIDQIDPALLRPGRVDLKLHYTFVSTSQAARMFTRFFPEASKDDAEKFSEVASKRQMTAADLQQHLLMYRNSAQDALENFAELQVRQ